MSDRLTIHNPEYDACAPVSAEDFRLRRRAVVWFIAAVTIGLAAIITGSQIDRWMYDSGAGVIDFSALKANRLASTSIRTESQDPRRNGTLDAAVND